ncbi:protein RNA-directed DNA methylation 3 [Artemisia annua]|uniref:Protein RNA-directed DNA methylation 3 n=1 Tax=Artemisia annua TaxID=35608 RepID=A0A2U1NZD7_ARTAN|nr:protein RNA-directed DNA methylation 3 [Artemisia annua]
MKQSEERDLKTRLCQGNVCCYFCGENWHLAKDCSCFKCVGHRARKCDQVGGGGDCVCYNCGEMGHIARECSHCCSLCGKNGQMGKDCRKLSTDVVKMGIILMSVLGNIVIGMMIRFVISVAGSIRLRTVVVLVVILNRDCGQVWGGVGGGGVCYYCGLSL